VVGCSVADLPHPRVSHIEGRIIDFRSSWNRNLHKTYSIPFILMLKI
jgi:hypothetical protein